MPLDTYANLKSAIGSWSHRTDVTTLIDDFIDLCEVEMYAPSLDGHKGLRLRAMESRDETTTGTTDQYHALPANFVEMRRLEIITNTGNWDVKFRTPSQLVYQIAAGRPKYFTVTTQLEFDRVPDQAYEFEMQYYKTLTALSSANTSNAVLTNYPTIYLYGSLWALNVWAENDAMEDRYYKKFMEAIEAANLKDQAGRYGPSPVMTFDGPTP